MVTKKIKSYHLSKIKNKIGVDAMNLKSKGVSDNVLKDTLEQRVLNEIKLLNAILWDNDCYFLLQYL